MTKFSANLGFLWTELSLPDAIHAAKASGFAAVECHWPYDVAASEVKAALDETGLPMLGLNTWRGDMANGDFGLSAVPGREDEARAAIDEAIAYAVAIKAQNIHVMAGNAQGEDARQAFVENLTHACDQGERHDVMILIEPINQFDAPDYFLRNCEQAVEIIEAVGSDHLKLMFDCYHAGRTEGDVIGVLNTVFPFIGHIQFASVPDRGEPDYGDVDFKHVFSEIGRLGWTKPLGAEYKPAGGTDEGLGWMRKLG